MNWFRLNPSLSSLPLQLLTFLVLPLFMLLIIVAFAGLTAHRIAIRDLIASHDVSAVRGAAISLSEQLDQQAAILTVLSDRMTQGEQPQEIIVSLGTLPETIFDGGIAFYDSQGRILAASPESRAWQNAPEVVETILNLETRGTRQYVPLVTPEQNNTQIAIITHVATEIGASTPYEDVLIVGVTSLNSLGLSAVLDSFRAPSAVVYIVSVRGQIIYHSDSSQTGLQVGGDDQLKAAVRGETGVDYTSDVQGNEIIIAFAPITESGWALIQEQAWAETISPLMRYSQASPLILLPGILIAGGVLWWGVRRVVQPLQDLENRAGDLAWGDFNSINQPVGGIAEIHRLQETLQNMAARIQQYQASMHHYIQATTRAQEEERARLARELHDQLVQSLIAIDHREQRLKRYLSDDPKGAALLDELRTLTADTINDLRRLIRDMRPVYLEDLGLLPALRMLVRKHDERTDPDIQFEFVEEGKPCRLTPEQEITLYRVAQEALNNISQHSHADQAQVSITFMQGVVEMIVKDNGVGFEMPTPITDLSNRGHYGLIGMVERANLIGADLMLDTAPKEGMRVTIRVNVKPTV